MALLGVHGPAWCSAAWADGLMLIQAGAFWMGSNADDENERPLHRVFVKDFWMDRHKVTNHEFARFLNARGTGGNGHRYFDPDDGNARIHLVEGRFMADRGFQDHPAVEVTWFGAREYCRWVGKRLPTEAEWEKVARGEDTRRYPWGDEPPSPERAVSGRDRNATAPTDGRPAGAGPTRVLDLVGNVREWTSSEYRAYPYRADDGREDTTRLLPRVVRGASHDDQAESLRLTIRRFYDHAAVARGHHHVGFRCATSEDLGGY